MYASQSLTRLISVQAYVSLHSCTDTEYPYGGHAVQETEDELHGTTDSVI